ncbi:uncharacterized protein [Clytia hemisphaerica]|uniref:Uncharacterized protein n=1 Tax=Clytia hemisphaerica TaxID=252671 RepID=A0A7M5XA43_9CNID
MTTTQTLRYLVTLAILTTITTGFPIGHHSKGLSTTCAYFSWVLCDAPKKRDNIETNEESNNLTMQTDGKTDSEEEEGENEETKESTNEGTNESTNEGTNESVNEEEMQQQIEKSLIDLQIEHIRKYVLNEILDSKNMTLPEKEHLLDEALELR